MTLSHDLALRPYQEEAIDAVRARFRAQQDQSTRTALVVMATGAGKTFTALSMVAATLQRSSSARVLWVAHRGELLTQPARRWRAQPQFASAGSCGIVQADQDDHDARLVLASTSTIARDPLGEGSRLRRIFEAGAPSLVVLDEAHHYASDAKSQWARLLQALQELMPEGRALHLLGLTATPERADRRDLTGTWGDSVAFRFSQHQALVSGFLVPPRLVDVPIVWSAQTALAMEDKDKQGEVGEMQTDELVRHTALEMAPYKGRAALVFCKDVKTAKRTCARLQQMGWRAATVIGEEHPSGSPEREYLLDAFQNGELDALVNVDTLSEGTDLPRCDMVVVARRVTSVVSWQQIIGRGMRLHGNKTDCIVLSLCETPHGLEYVGELLDMTPGEGGTGSPREQAGGARRIAELQVVPVRWVEVQPGQAYMVELGRSKKGTPRGQVWVTRSKGRDWMAHRVIRDRPWDAPEVRPLMAAPASRDIAESYGRSLFLQCKGLVHREADWREQAPSEKQREAIAKHRITVAGETAGDYSDALAAHFARRHWPTLQLRLVGSTRWV